MAVRIVLNGFRPGSPGRVEVLTEADFEHYCATRVPLDDTDLEIRGDKSEIISFLHSHEHIRLQLYASGGYYIHCGKQSRGRGYSPLNPGVGIQALVRVPRGIATVVAEVRNAYRRHGLPDSGSADLGPALERMGQHVGPSSRSSRFADGFRRQRVVEVSRHSTGYAHEVHVPGYELTLRGLKKLADVML